MFVGCRVCKDICGMVGVKKINVGEFTHKSSGLELYRAIQCLWEWGVGRFAALLFLFKEVVVK